MPQNMETYQTAAGTYTIQQLLGKGKSGYAYLAEFEGKPRVLKLMHTEPISYYTFEGNKVTKEVADYERLKSLGVKMPDLLEQDAERGYVVKEWIAGKTVAQSIADGDMTDAIYAQIFSMSNVLEQHLINLDYFPTNFIIHADGELYYIDYEINPYSDQWNFVNWAVWYWVNQAGMRQFLATGDGKFINEHDGSGVPLKDGLAERVADLIRRFGK